jgi:hypothetical protein
MDETPILNEMDELCSGCTTYERGIREGFKIECDGYSIQDTKCPCINCLIKVMCWDICEEFHEREKDIWRKLGKRGYI